MHQLSLVLICLSMCFAQLCSAESISFKDSLKLTDNDRIILNGFIQHAVDFADKVNPESVAKKCHESPESFAWVDFRHLNCLTIAYQLTEDTQYLDLFHDSFAVYRSIMKTGSDDYLGWYGLALKPRRLKDNPDLEVDEIQMSFRAISILSTWIAAARSNESYASTHTAQITALLALMEEHLFPKWDARGFFLSVPGKGGVYQGLEFPIEGQTTLPYEKLGIMHHGCLQLYNITGNPIYMKRALELGMWFKAHLALKDGHYEWFNWVPASQRDVHPEKEDSWRSWIAPDPQGGWYVSGLSIALNLYKYGLLFDDQDLERFIKTQKTQCWNGDFEKPIYASVNGTTPAESKWIKGRFLSDQLARYDAELSRLAFTGIHETFRVEKAGNPWHGGANAQGYILAKYLSHTGPDNKYPAQALGDLFLSDPFNQEFYGTLNKEVSEPGFTEIPKPSVYFASE